MITKVFSFLAVCLVGTLPLFSGTAEARVKAQVVRRQRTVAAYRIALQIGPAEVMRTKGKIGTGERMLGGRMARCAMGHSMGSMSMGKACNHHLELHVFNRRSGRVITHARVRIILYDTRKHMTIYIPIMAMMGATAGIKDYHYGNNIFAGPGSYRITVWVNRVRASFFIHLM